MYPRSPHSTQMTDAIKEAFEATWVVVQARDPLVILKGISSSGPPSAGSSRCLVPQACAIPLSSASGPSKACC